MFFFFSQVDRARLTTECRVSLRTRMMDLRKCTNHPYLIEYPLSEDGVFYRSDQELIDCCGKLKVGKLIRK